MALPGTVVFGLLASRTVRLNFCCFNNTDNNFLSTYHTLGNVLGIYYLIWSSYKFTYSYCSPFKTEVPQRLNNWPSVSQLEHRWWCWNVNAASVPLKHRHQENESLVLVMGKEGPTWTGLPWPEQLHLFNQGPPLVRSTSTWLKEAQPSLVSLPDLGNQWIMSPAFQWSSEPWEHVGPGILLFESGKLEGRVEDSGDLYWEPVFQTYV